MGEGSAIVGIVRRPDPDGRYLPLFEIEFFNFTVFLLAFTDYFSYH